MTKKCASCDKIVIFLPISYVNKAHHSPLSLRSINQRIIARKTEWCNPFFAHQRVQLTTEWAHCERKHEVKMTETLDLNRPVICLRYATRVVTHPVKSPRTASDYRFRRPHRSHYQLRVVGALRLSTGVVSDSFLNRIGRRRERCVRRNLVEKNRSDYQLYRRERR